MSRNDEEKAVSAVSFISSSLWYIEDFSITNERKITNVTQRKQTKQTMGSEVIYSQVIILKTIVKLSQFRDIPTEKLEKK
jgi:hypothetical protein